MVLAMAAMTIALSLTSCIDEDLSDCGKDYHIGYTVRLRTNISTELSSELTSEAEQAFGLRLADALCDVFTDHARDIDLAFYTTDQHLAQHEQHQMDASQASYTIYLPVKDYQHIALANSAAEPLVQLDGADNVSTAALIQQSSDTIDSHSVGLFSARLPMKVENRDQQFDVNLYMVNSASCVVMRAEDGVVPDEVWGYADGFATSFSINDSTYAANRQTTVRERLLHDTGSDLYGLYAASMPSLISSGRVSDASWHIYIYVRINGKVTKTTLTVSEPLLAGQLRVLKGIIRRDGSISTHSQSVGVSVSLDWKPGGSHDVEI